MFNQSWSPAEEARLCTIFLDNLSGLEDVGLFVMQERRCATQQPHPVATQGGRFLLQKLLGEHPAVTPWGRFMLRMLPQRQHDRRRIPHVDPPEEEPEPQSAQVKALTEMDTEQKAEELQVGFQPWT